MHSARWKERRAPAVRQPQADLPEKAPRQSQSVCEVAHPHRIEHTVEVIAFVLDETRVETTDRSLDRPAVGVEAGVMQTGCARDPATQAGNRQTAFPALVHLVAKRGQHRVGEDGPRNCLGVRIAWVVAHAENDQAQVNANLRRRQASSVKLPHGFAQIIDQGVQLPSAELFDRLRPAPEARIAHFQHRPNHCRRASVQSTQAPVAWPHREPR